MTDLPMESDGMQALCLVVRKDAIPDDALARLAAREAWREWRVSRNGPDEDPGKPWRAEE